MWVLRMLSRAMSSPLVCCMCSMTFTATRAFLQRPCSKATCGCFQECRMMSGIWPVKRGMVGRRCSCMVQRAAPNGGVHHLHTRLLKAGSSQPQQHCSASLRHTGQAAKWLPAAGGRKGRPPSARAAHCSTLVCFTGVDNRLSQADRQAVVTLGLGLTDLTRQAGRQAASCHNQTRGPNPQASLCHVVTPQPGPADQSLSQG